MTGIWGTLWPFSEGQDDPHVGGDFPISKEKQYPYPWRQKEAERIWMNKPTKFPPGYYT